MINPFVHIQKVLNLSGQEAQRTAGSEVNVEHLMLGLLREENGEVSQILEQFGVNLKDFRKHIDESLHLVGAIGHNKTQPSSIPYDDITNNVIRNSIKEAWICDNVKEVEPRHLLLSILRQGSNNVAHMLSSMGINYDAVFNLLSGEEMEKEDSLEEKPEREQREAMTAGGIKDDDKDLIDPDEEPLDFEKQQQQKPAATKETPSKKTSTPIIDKYSVDYTKLAAEDKLDPVVGREKEIHRVLEILGRRKKNNPVLIGEPGVGKSAIVEGLAQLIQSQQTSPMFFNKRVINLDMTSVVAGTKYRGQFEERIKGILKEAENNPNVILFMDEIHTLIGAGGAEGTMDAANILKPALARGTIQCIGATTFDEYRKTIEKDGALERRFQKVVVKPTTKEETLQILNNIKGKYEQHHCVTYTDKALEAAVKLTDRYITDRCFPDKAIDVIDEAGSRVHINNASIPVPYLELEKHREAIIAKKQEAVITQNFELAASWRDQQTNVEKEIEEMKQKWQNGEIGEHAIVDEETITQVVSMMVGVPVQRIAEDENKRLRDMASVLQSKVIGQDDAIAKVVKAIQRSRVGLRDPNHPIGAFMFLGPTGVGKTYLAKKLAEEMFGSANDLIRIDMGEYTEEQSTSRLVGASPGYVGYEEGGQLTEKVHRKPYSIVLLDEIEKANPKVFNLLLQLLDEGRLTDGNGRLVDFRNTIIILTSNAGTRQLKDFGKGVGFNAGGLSGNALMNEKDKEYARSIVQKSLAKQFAPEFLNRLDEIITFDQLDLNAIKRIIDLELKPLTKRIEDMGYHFQITDKAKEMVANKGYDVQFGARPLKRAIQNYIEDGVCEMLLNGNLKPGDTISVGKNPKKEELTFK